MSNVIAHAPPELTIVLPCYNEGEIISAFVEMVNSHAERTGLTFEILAIDDGSTDNTGDVLKHLEQRLPVVRILRFSRNFGHMAALTAGLDHARATGAVITMDSDGQHPPNLIPLLVERWKGGVDIVQGVRRETSDATMSKRLSSQVFYSLLNWLSDTPVVSGAADYRLMSRRAVDALKTLPEKARFVRGLVFWIGFKMEFVEFSAPARLGGKTKYSLGKMLAFALDGITSFSTVLLRLSVLSGVVIVSVALLYALWIVGLYLFQDESLVSGWSSLMLAVLFMGGLNLIAVGILGEYIGRIYAEVKNRPLYILREES